jgi:hypothetical protein
MRATKQSPVRRESFARATMPKKMDGSIEIAQVKRQVPKQFVPTGILLPKINAPAVAFRVRSG